MNLRLPLAALAAAFTLLTAALHAQVPQLINYQGRVAVGAVNFNSPPNGQFKFALVNPTGTTTYWSNDNTSVGGSQPTAAVSLLVTKGLYSVLLGDTTLTGMPTAIPASVWTNADVRLRVWFNDGTNGFQLLTPDQRFAAAGYAMITAGVNLPVTTSASAGVIMQNSNRLMHTFGTNNFFAGLGAGNFTLSGSSNTALGNNALDVNTTGAQNTAVGADGALGSNTTGNFNTAIGDQALALNVAGSSNTGVGFEALGRTTAANNTAVGYNALFNNTIGAGNIALGPNAGLNLTTGGGNIDIGNNGVAAEANIIRIGTSQTDTYLTGIIHGNGSALTGVTATIGAGTITSTHLATVGPPSSTGGQVLSYNGSALQWVAPTTGGGGTLTLPYSQTGASPGPAFTISNSSTGGAIFGTSANDGVHGTSTGATKSGVWGDNTGGGTGVAGSTTSGKGVWGSATNGNGVYGQASTGGNAIYGDNPTGTGVAGTSNSGFAMYAASNTNYGIYAQSGSQDGVHGVSTSRNGVYGVSSGGLNVAGVWGENTGSNGTAVVGYAPNGTGLYVRGGLQAGAFDGNVNFNDIGSSGNGGVVNTKSGKLFFGSSTRQMLNLWGDEDSSYAGTQYGIGVQAATLYFRTSSAFAWFLGGTHVDSALSPGDRGIAPGTTVMKLESGLLTVAGAANEQAYLGGDGTGNDVQVGSRNSSVTTVAAFNTATSRYMDFFCSVLHIMGGADVAEPFPISTQDIAKGSVVVIDDAHPGQLKPSHQSYDRRVAGIISGANGISPGIALQQEGVIGGGQNVALSGRVYVRATNSNGEITPGDLLTTSESLGLAMKATDHERRQGAIIGKAMGSIDQSTGMVLVLVTLQ